MGGEIARVAVDDARDGGTPPAVPEVIVTGSLSPLEPVKLVDADNANNTVPWGGTIEHVLDGEVPMKVVYSAEGQPKFKVHDTNAERIPVPGGNLTPATGLRVCLQDP